MRQLLLLRHAKSSWDDPSLSDHARPLNTRGRQAAAATREAMRELALRPQLVVVSSARRTLQTLEALEPWDQPPVVEPLDALYLAGPDAMLDVLRGLGERADRVLLIGHNPGLHELALTLLDADQATPDRNRLLDGYPTGALAEFAVEAPWPTLGRGGGRLVRFLPPRDRLPHDA